MSVSDTPTTGTDLAGYRIGAVLGRGGMGVVYLAEDLGLGRKVATKLLAPHLAGDAAFRERYLRESQLAASLDHPNIVPVYEAGEADGRLFIAMRYVQGPSLAQRLAEGPLDPRETVALLAQVASALDAAHARGLVHRDVKPSNILIAPAEAPDGSDHAYLADFGLARRLDESATVSGSSRSLGTVAYVAPEGIADGPIDGRADVYSLGCVLFECLAGEPPFRGRSASVLFAHLRDEPPSLVERRPELPRAIDPVVRTALAKSPEDRYETCRDLVSAARDALCIAEPARPRWARAPVLVVLVVLALIAAGLASFFALRGGGSPSLGRGDALARIDPATNEVAASIPVRDDPSAIGLGADGAVWVGSRAESTVSRIDPATDEVTLTESAQGTPTDIATQPGLVIVANGPLDNNVALISDPDSGASIVRLPAGYLDFGSARVAAGGAGIWVAAADRSVSRIDGSSRLVDRVEIPPPADERADAFFSAIAVGEDTVWVLGDPLDRAVWRIDPGAGAPAARISLPFAPKDIAVGEGGVWVTSQLDDTLSRIDQATGEITATVHVGRGAAGVAVGAGSVWIANAVDGTVSRVDPRTLATVTIDVEGRPDDVVAGEAGVWVTTYAA